MTLEIVDLDGVRIGVARGAAGPGDAALAEDLDVTLGVAGDARWLVVVPDVDAAAEGIAGRVARAPLAATTLLGLLRLTASAPVRNGLVAESLAYSMLLAGPEFARWLAARARRPVPRIAQPVLLGRDGDVLTVTLNVPERRNALSAAMRESLVEAFDLARIDDTITEVHLRGAGAAFCSGGDLDEFGTTPDVATAHLIRTTRSVAARIDAVRDRVHAHLHGACIGAGIELPSFAGRVTAHPATFFQLPELDLGLVPGAGGCVGITKRIGRWRCAYLVLSGERIGVDTALEWGLIDALE